MRDVDGVIPLAFACFLLAYIEGVSAARSLAQKNGYEIDARQELLALGAANAAVAFGQGYPVAGGLSQSTVNDKAGARTALALVFASCAIALCLIFLTDLLRNLPDVVLAAIVLVAVKGLVNIPELKRVHALSRTEFWIAMVAFASVLLLGILQGVLLAAIVSMLLLIGRAAAPPVARLGRLPGTRRYADRARNPDAQDVPGVLIVRVGAGLLYFNVGHVRDEVRRLVADAGEGLRLVVWDLSTSPYVDIAGARLLSELERELAARGVALRLAEAHATRARSRPQGIRHGDGCVRCKDRDRRRDRGTRARSHAGETGSARVTWTAPSSRRVCMGHPVRENTARIALFSASTSASNVAMPCARATIAR